MSTICMFGTCQSCGLVQYMGGNPCRDCGGEIQQGGMKPLVSAFIAGAEWHEGKSMFAGVDALVESAQEFKVEFSVKQSRADFEEMAKVNYPAALAMGRHSTYGSYLNSGLEKRWSGWKLCDEFRFKQENN